MKIRLKEGGGDPKGDAAIGRELFDGGDGVGVWTLSLLGHEKNY